ncbi:MAG: iron chaperone, partial [Acutalibacteraceae bacterium]
KAGAVDEYIAAQIEDVQPLLQKIRETIKSAAPGATEKISWQIPTFWQGENLIHFAAFKKHISIFPGGEATGVFAEKLKGYKTSKGTIQFPLGKPIDYDLIAEITRWRVSQVQKKRRKGK